MKEIGYEEKISAGFIICNICEMRIEYLLLKHREGHWAFPKGMIKKNETLILCALRELKEETGLKNIIILSEDITLKESYYIEKHKIHKTVYYFLAKSEEKKIKIDGDEILDFKWCEKNKAKEILTYNQSKNLLQKANEIIKKTIV